MNEIRAIADQLARAHDGDAWYGDPTMKVLRGINAGQASRRPVPRAHSIWEIVLHVAAWQTFVARALEGEPMPSWELPDEENWPPVKDTGEAAWREALASVGDGNRRVREALRRLGDDDLDKTVANREYSFYFMLHGVVQHIGYHAGQISLLKKAAGHNEKS